MFRSKSFDTSAKEQVRFEKASSDGTSKKFKKAFEDPQPLPEVSQERYYQTTKALDIGKGKIIVM